MHKTYIILEDWQYEALRSLAEREQRSIFALVRELLAGHHESARRRLTTIEDLGADADATGQEHDTFLYRTP
jgi:hypothetical protein